MIKLQDITKTYYMGQQSIPVLKGINLEINKGDLLAIVGASGSGKSTMMNMIGLLDHPSSGECYLNNQAVSKLSSDAMAKLRNQTIGFVFQSFFLLPRLSAWQNVGLPLVYRDIPPDEIKKQAFEHLTRVGMGDLTQNKPNELSGGQQQRVAIARALIGDPDIILADEPTGALDTKTGKEVMDILLDLNQKGHTVIIITHDTNIAERCQRIITMSDGLIINEK